MSFVFNPPNPSPELVQQWVSEFQSDMPEQLYLARRAAHWGYSQCEAEYERAAMDIYPPSDK